MKLRLVILLCSLAFHFGCDRPVVEPPRPERQKADSQVDTDEPRTVAQEQFSIFIHKAKMHVELKGAKQPVTAAKLQEAGVDITELQGAFVDIMHTIGLDPTKDVSVEYVGPIDTFPAAEFVISDIPIGDSKIQYFQVNIFGGEIYVSYFDMNGRIPGSVAKNLAIDWGQFAKNVSRLQSALASEQVSAVLSTPIAEGAASSFALSYELRQRHNP